jgi:ABC-type iron transport system FetAB ATPase subunit
MGRLVIEGLQTRNGGPFSFSVERGECVTLYGPSGCGKTLLLRAIADLDPAEGTVLLDGESRAGMTAPQWRKKVGWLAAESAWWFDRVGEHFPMVGKVNGDFPDVWKKRIQFLEQLGFGEEVLGWRIERMSTGEKQRLALFRLLLNEPQVLLLDEPTAALDPTNVFVMEKVIGEFRRSTGAAVVWVSHDPEQVQRVADHSLKFNGSRLEAAE